MQEAILKKWWDETGFNYVTANNNRRQKFSHFLLHYKILGKVPKCDAFQYVCISVAMAEVNDREREIRNDWLEWGESVLLNDAWWPNGLRIYGEKGWCECEKREESTEWWKTGLDRQRRGEVVLACSSGVCVQVKWQREPVHGRTREREESGGVNESR